MWCVLASLLAPLSHPAASWSSCGAVLVVILLFHEAPPRPIWACLLVCGMAVRAPDLVLSLGPCVGRRVCVRGPLPPARQPPEALWRAACKLAIQRRPRAWRPLLPPRTCCSPVALAPLLGAPLASGQLGHPPLPHQMPAGSPPLGAQPRYAAAPGPAHAWPRCAAVAPWRRRGRWYGAAALGGAVWAAWPDPTWVPLASPLAVAQRQCHALLPPPSWPPQGPSLPQFRPCRRAAECHGVGLGPPGGCVEICALWRARRPLTYGLLWVDLPLPSRASPPRPRRRPPATLNRAAGGHLSGPAPPQSVAEVLQTPHRAPGGDGASPGARAAAVWGPRWG